MKEKISWNNGIKLGKNVNTEENATLNAPQKTLSDDFTQALTSARIAFYDNFRSAPRITEIAPTSTAEFIENLTTTIYSQAQAAGGTIPYTVIREVSENFIHAQFKEIVVSIFEHGNTIRFSDQGPGINQKEKAQQPGFSSATDPMKKYIRGVGSGLPLVKEYLSFSHGRITIEDNLNTGAVITISVLPEEEVQEPVRTTPATSTPAAQSTPVASEPPRPRKAMPHLNDREKEVMILLSERRSMRLSDIANELSLSLSTTHRTLDHLEKSELVYENNKIRYISEYGDEVVEDLLYN